MIAHSEFLQCRLEVSFGKFHKMNSFAIIDIENNLSKSKQKLTIQLHCIPVYTTHSYTFLYATCISIWKFHLRSNKTVNKLNTNGVHQNILTKFFIFLFFCNSIWLRVAYTHHNLYGRKFTCTNKKQFSMRHMAHVMYVRQYGPWALVYKI